MTQVGQELLDFLPFIGSVDAANVEYRQELLNNALIVIGRNFWFGSPDYKLEPEMQSMIQGERVSSMWLTPIWGSLWNLEWWA